MYLRVPNTSSSAPGAAERRQWAAARASRRRLAMGKTAGQGNWLSPEAGIVRDIVPTDKIAQSRESFSLKGAPDYAQGTYLSPKQVPGWERMSDRELMRAHQMFGMGALPKASPDYAQGTYLSPRQVPKKYRMSDKKLYNAPERFMGAMPASPDYAQGTYLSPQQAAAATRMSARQLIKHRQMFGMGALPKASPDYGQGTYLSPRQVPKRELMSSKALARHRQLFGMGSLPKASPDYAQGTFLAPDQVPAKYRESASKVAGKNERFDLGQLTYANPSPQLATSFIERQITLPKICDADTGTCIQYKAPDKALVGTSFVQGRTSLPAFYSHPTLGPYGVDPNQAYQYWLAQQSAVQAQPYQVPMAIFGSPGFVSQPGQGTSVAQPPAYNPYSGSFPLPGTSVETF